MKGSGQKDSSGSFKDLPMVKVGVILTSKWIIMMDFKPLNVIKIHDSILKILLNGEMPPEKNP